MRPQAERSKSTPTGTLLAGAQAGRRDDLEELFRRELPPLRRWAFANVPSRIRRAGDTDDLVQLALLRTLRRLPHLRTAEEGTLQPYLRRVVTNLVRDHARANARSPELVSLRPEEDAPLENESQLDSAIVTETYERYRAALKTLNPREREALSARIERGLDYAAVARCAGCASAGAARATVGRALERVTARMRAARRV